MSTSPRKVTGTVVLTITYGFVGYWGEGFVNSTATSTIQFNFEDQNIVEVVEQLRIYLIDKLDESLKSEQAKQKFGEYSQRVFSLYHVVSESQMFIPS